MPGQHGRERRGLSGWNLDEIPPGAAGALVPARCGQPGVSGWLAAVHQHVIAVTDVDLARPEVRVQRLGGRVGPTGDFLLGRSGQQQRFDHARIFRQGKAGVGLGLVDQQPGAGGDDGCGAARVVVRRDDVGFDASHAFDHGIA